MLKFIDYLNEGKEFKQLKFIVDPIIEQIILKLKELLKYETKIKEIYFTSDKNDFNTYPKNPYIIFLEINNKNLPTIKISNKDDEFSSYSNKEINIQINLDINLQNLQNIKILLKNELHHEITHYFQYIKNDPIFKSGYTVNKMSDYHLEPAEIEAHLKGWYNQIQFQKNQSLRQKIIDFFTSWYPLEEQKPIIDTYLKKAQEMGLNLDKYQDYESSRDKFRRTKVRKIM